MITLPEHNNRTDDDRSSSLRINSARTAVRNVTTLTLAQIINFIGSFTASILIIRYLGIDDFGRYSLVITLVTIFGFAVDLGLSQLVIREVAKNHAQAEKYFGNFFLAQLGIAFTVFIGLLATGAALHYPYQIMLGILLVGSGMVIGALMRPFTAILAGLEAMHIIAAINVITTVLNIALLLILIHQNWGLRAAFLINPVINLASLLILFWRVRRVFRPKLDWDAQLLRRLLILAIPFALLMGFNIIYAKIDVFMISQLLRSDGAVGLYSSAYRIIDALIIVPSTISGALFPLITRQLSDKAATDFVVSRAIKFTAAFGIPTALGVTVLAPNILTLLFGAQYAEAANVLRVLIWMIAMISCYSIIGNLLVAANRVGLLVKLNIIGMVLNVLLNLFMIPKFGILGAAISSILAEILIMSLHIWFARSLFRYRQLWSAGLKIVLAGSIMVLALVYMRLYSILLTIPAVAVLYAIVLLSLRFLNTQEFRLIRSATTRQ